SSNRSIGLAHLLPTASPLQVMWSGYVHLLLFRASPPLRLRRPASGGGRANVADGLATGDTPPRARRSPETTTREPGARSGEFPPTRHGPRGGAGHVGVDDCAGYIVRVRGIVDAGDPRWIGRRRVRQHRKPGQQRREDEREERTQWKEVAEIDASTATSEGGTLLAEAMQRPLLSKHRRREALRPQVWSKRGRP